MQRNVFDDVNQPSDVVAVTDLAFARVSPRWWRNNPGALLVIPRDHHENLYELPAAFSHAVIDLAQQVASAMRTAYPCDGITLLQNNEPAGGQDVWHVHVHVVPRHHGDGLYDLSKEDRQDRWVTGTERRAYADRLSAELGAPRQLG